MYHQQHTIATENPWQQRASSQEKRFNTNVSEIISLINMKEKTPDHVPLQINCTYKNSRGSFVQSQKESVRYRISKEENQD